MTLNTIRILGLSLMTLATASNLLNTCAPHVRLFIWSIAALGAAIWGSTVIVRMFDRARPNTNAAIKHPCRRRSH